MIGLVFLYFIVETFVMLLKPSPAAMKSKCASNMKQINLAFLQYVQDYDNRLPPMQATVYNKTVSWRYLVSTYTRDKSVFQCPVNPANHQSDLEQDGFFRSYAVNSCNQLGSDDGGPYGINYNGIDVSIVKKQENLILLSESTAPTADFDLLMPEKYAQPASNHGGSISYHKVLSNYAFLDGHVKSMMPIDTISNENLWVLDNKRFTREDEAKARQVLEFTDKLYSAGYTLDSPPWLRRRLLCSYGE